MKSLAKVGISHTIKPPSVVCLFFFSKWNYKTSWTLLKHKLIEEEKQNKTKSHTHKKKHNKEINCSSKGTGHHWTWPSIFNKHLDEKLKLPCILMGDCIWKDQTCIRAIQLPVAVSSAKWLSCRMPSVRHKASSNWQMFCHLLQMHGYRAQRGLNMSLQLRIYLICIVTWELRPGMRPWRHKN